MSGQSLIGEIFEPTKRGLAIGIFLAGTVLGPCIGPVIGGVIVTYRPWRVIFYLQAALVFAALVVAFFVIPTLRPRLRPTSTSHFLSVWDPRPLLRLFRFPNLCLIYLACGTQTFAQYTMITPVRYVMNPRFNLTSPLQSGLFFLAPGFGFVLGSCVGGKWADIVVKRYIKKRNGERIPEDRLKAGMFATLIGSPLGMLLYSWSIQNEVGGMPLPIIGMFISGLAQMAGMSAMNTYCTEIKPGHSVAILAGKYLVQNCLSAAASAVILPFINAIGVGWAGTVATGIILVGAAAVITTAYLGQRMRNAVEGKAEK
ncbi:MFS general substrate transporter [Ascobolus immersus RN42]|uniref:MFS general substrate transporter n=1 Tax=Ascobolus immersus RN42 TaxID=1160509 RepID=A0A3N4IKC6_ASCIM|nr:MFS general substrate transporter [Ascobolus immersus RN42]